VSETIERSRTVNASAAAEATRLPTSGAATKVPHAPAAAEGPVRKSRRLLVVLSFAAIYLIWGSTYLAIRVGVRTLPAFLMAGCRFVAAGSILLAILRASGVRAPSAREWRHSALAGVLMLTVGNGLVTWAEQRVPSNLAALLVAAVPLYVALLDWLRPGGTRPERQVLLGILIGFGGMALLVVPQRAAALPAAASGVAALLIAALGWATGSLYARYGIRHPHAVMAAAQQMIAGGAAMLLIALARGEVGRASLAGASGESLVAFAYLTIVGSLVAFSAFGYLVVVTTPARLSTTADVNPVVAVILGWLILGESLTPRALAGAALIVAAVMVMTVGGNVLQAARRAFGRRRPR